MKPKDSSITIRCTQLQKDTIEKNADKLGMNRSNYILHQCLGKKKCKYRTKKEKEICKTVVDIQEDLNLLESIAGASLPSSSDLFLIINSIREKERIIWHNSLR